MIRTGHLCRAGGLFCFLGSALVFVDEETHRRSPFCHPVWLPNCTLRLLGCAARNMDCPTRTNVRSLPSLGGPTSVQFLLYSICHE